MCIAEPISWERSTDALKHWYWIIGMAALLLGLLLWADLLPRQITRLLQRDNTWQTMQADGIWRVGMDPSFPPFEWLDGAGKPTGYDVELAERMAAEWGLTLEIVPIGFDSLIDAVQTGRVDSVVSALPFDERLTRDLAYSPPYFDAGVALAVRQPATITSVADLTGRAVAVEWGSMGDMVGRRLQRADDSLELVPFETPAEAVDALIAGQSADGQPIDALLVDHVTLRVVQEQGAPLVRVGELLESNPYVIAMPIHARNLQDAVAETLATFQSAGVLDELEAKWFTQME